MQINGRILIIIVTVLTTIAALFCVIGLGTKGWQTISGGLFNCGECRTAPAALSIISFLLLIATIVVLCLTMFGKLNGALRFIAFALLLVSTIFLLGTFVSIIASTSAYSYNLMVASHFFTYVALALMAYWLGKSDGTSA